MGWENLSDRILKTGISTFGVSLTYYPSDGGSYIARGIFNENYVSIDASTGIEYSSSQPNLTVRLADLQAPPNRGDRLEVRGQMYNVMDSEPDSEGGSVLILQEA